MTKEISLKTIFLKFLIQIIFSWAVLLVVFISIIELLVLSHVILPANTVEKNIQSWLARLNQEEPFVSEEIPVGADYACFSSDGSLLWTNLDADRLDTASSLARSGLPASKSGDSEAVALEQTASESAVSKTYADRSIYLKVPGNGQTLILNYQIYATFTAPFLQRIFPSAEPFILFLLLLLFLADLVFFILHYSRKLEKELLVLQHASEQISVQNLDFETRRTGISELNRVLDSLLLLRDELRHSLQDQWQMQQQKKNQLSSLAHDIKTPLTLIRGNAELLQESPLNHEQQEYNSFILENTQQIQNYVAQMLEISRSQTHPESSCTLKHLLAELEKTAQSLCFEKQLTFSIQKEDLPENLLLPEDSMKRILANIIDNAVQYSPTGKTITLQMTSENFSDAAPRLVFTVADEGCGFSEEALVHGTTEFYRADGSRGSKEHFGMGLAIVNKLTQNLDGSLQLSNRKEGGAVVTVKIPVKLG